MTEQSSSQQQGGNEQPQQVQQTPTNPLLNRPSNPNLDIIIHKGNDSVIERNKQGGQQITEKKSGGNEQHSNE